MSDTSPLIDNKNDSELTNATPIIDAIPILKDSEESPYIPPTIPATAATDEQPENVKKKIDEKIDQKMEKQTETPAAEQNTEEQQVVPIVKKEEEGVEESKDEETAPLIPPSAPTQEERSTTSIVPFVPEDLGRESVEITCPYCKNKGMTRVEQEMSFMTLMFIILSIVIFPFALLALCCTKKGMDTVHRCRHCVRIVGKTESFTDCL